MVSVLLVGWSMICYSEVVEGFHTDAHCQKGIPSHNVNGLCLEDTGLCCAIPTPVGEHHYTGCYVPW